LRFACFSHGIAAFPAIADPGPFLVVTGMLPPVWTVDPIFGSFLVAAGLLTAFLFVVSRFVPPLAIDVSADFPTFYPNRPTERRLLVLRLNLTRRARVTIEVYDEFNRRVVTLVEPAVFGAGHHFRLWDGRRANGVMAGEGSYWVQATSRTLTATAKSALWVCLDGTTESRRRTLSPGKHEAVLDLTAAV
jgi:hypothetical protein